jgi:hypothetical protein
MLQVSTSVPHHLTIELPKEFADKVTERCSLDRRKYLFNEQEGGDDCNYFLFGKGIINEANSADKEYLKEKLSNNSH